MSEAYGTCFVTRTCDRITGGYTLNIERADPVIRIAPELLAKLAEPSSGWPATYDAKARILRITGTNRTVVYRIREMLEERPGARGYFDYIGEWPD
jgi:hypothetical protein